MDVVFSNPVLMAAPIFFVCLFLEFLYSKKKGHKSVYSFWDLSMNAFILGGIIVLEIILKFISAAALFYWAYNFFNPETDGVRTNLMGYSVFGWSWYIWIVCQVFEEFGHYWLHRFNHTIRFMWAAHVMHHSSEHFNFGTAFRLSWISKIYKPFFYMWIPALGFHPEMVLMCYGIEIVWQFFLHTSYCPKLKWMDIIFVTPKQHQVHHAKNIEYMDKNHGAIFNIFDKLFGSWKEYDASIEIEYGVTHAPNLKNPADIILHEYRAIWKDVKNAKSVYEALMYVFGPPGWCPNGKTLTVKQMQRQLQLKEA